ncbi:fimbrial protein [Citrobacter amalonaticus]|uniref:fimbrial protein n=1 Tax=Citrobacter amalonaticus TaxID=35703 RepID=UPI00255B3F86|nr:fimbrial protein [Citrobacter amalonaticus]MDL4619957.1 fimbrial protein [Citrobacter amalonaticus]MDL4624055.1 fimbrial protein [Citrobacter amalonaticus]
MKKLVLGSAILAVLGMTSSAMAANNSGSVNFTGSVSSATCELSVTDAAGAKIPAVDLGTVSNTSGTATAVQFKLVPTDNTCLAKNAAQISWTSNNLIAQGFSNATTNGTNAYMTLQALNATETGDKSYVKSGQTAFNYSARTGGLPSFNYSAQLVKPTGTVTPGAFTTTASYTIAYK